MVVGHFSQPLLPQLAWLAVTSLCLISWFSSSILEMVLRTASLTYPGQGTHSQEKKQGVMKCLGSLGTEDTMYMCVCMVDEDV